MRRLAAGLTAGVIGLLGAGPVASAAALGETGFQLPSADPVVKGLTIEWYTTGATDLLSGQKAALMLSVGCSSADKTPCTSVRVDIPWGPDSNLPDPALGATAIKDWVAMWSANAGLIDSTVGKTRDVLRKTDTGWYFVLTNPLPAGEVLNIAVEITTPRGVTPDGTTFTAGAVASSSGVASVSADPLEFTVRAAPELAFLPKLVEDFVGLPIRPSFQLTNIYSSADGSLAYQKGTCLLEGTLPEDLEFTDLTTVEWDPSTRRWSAPCPVETTSTQGSLQSSVAVPPVKAVPDNYQGQKYFPVQISGVLVGQVERVASAVYLATVRWVPRAYPSGLFDKGSYSNFLETASEAVGRYGSASANTFAYQLAGAKKAWTYTDSGAYKWTIKGAKTASPVSIEIVDYFPCMDSAQSPGVYVSSSDGRCASPAFYFTGFRATSTILNTTYISVRYLHGDGSVREIDVAALNALTTSTARAAALAPTVGEVVTGIELKATRAGSDISTFLLDGYWDASLVVDDNVYNSASFKLAYEGDAVGSTATLTERNIISAAEPKASIRWNNTAAGEASPGAALGVADDVNIDVLWGLASLADKGQLFFAYRDVDGLIAPTWKPSGTTWTDSKDAEGVRILSRTLTQSPTGQASWVSTPSGSASQTGASPVVTSTLGQYTLEAVVGIPGVRLDSCEWVSTGGWITREDNVLLVDGAAYGAPAGTSLCLVTRVITVHGQNPGVQVSKFIRGDLDDEIKGQGELAEISADGTGWAQYTLKVVNVGSTALKDTTVYDFLPAPGDVYLAGGTAGMSRGSSKAVTLAEPPTVPEGWAVAYSTSTNACAPEISSISGCVDDWLTTAPADLGTVRALRFTYTGSIPVAALASEIGIKVTVGAYDRSRDALWNTAAIRSQVDAAGYPINAIAPVESARVGFGKVSYGFLVQKVGADATGEVQPGGLGGAQFELRTDAGGAPGELVSGASSFAPVEGVVGRWRATVPSGTYWLIETATPAGYMPLVAPVKVVIGAAGEVTLPDVAAGAGISLVSQDADQVVQIVNYPGLRLPDTGGVGAGHIVAGLALLVLAGTAATILWRRRTTATA